LGCGPPLLLRPLLLNAAAADIAAIRQFTAKKNKNKILSNGKWLGKLQSPFNFVHFGPQIAKK